LWAILKSKVKRSKLRDMETLSSTMPLQSSEHIVGQFQRSTKLYYMFGAFIGT
ncbi:hypothetical protein BCV72DRAFT_216877, partial [Rhizopus microsporus var. microsporus]